MKYLPMYYLYIYLCIYLYVYIYIYINVYKTEVYIQIGAMLLNSSLGAHKGFLHPKALKGLMVLSCSGFYKDTKTVCLSSARYN